MREKLNGWLGATLHVSKDGRYRHLRLRENLAKRPEILEDLKGYIQKVHSDAQSFFEKPTHSLDPLEEDDIQEGSSPAQSSFYGYPAMLPMQTLMGYLGEVFAGIIAENFSPFGDDRWKVPAYLFCFHNAAFQYLEVLRQTGQTRESVVGRTGDDCLAFTLINGDIEKILYCEAKCLKEHNTGKVKEACEKFNKSAIVDIYQVIQILKSNPSQEARVWREALDRFLLREKEVPSLREKSRYNFMSYIHGDLPTRKASWLPEQKPPALYDAIHPFEVVEIHLHGIEDLIHILYNKERVSLAPTST